MKWVPTVQPSGFGAVTLSLVDTTSCIGTPGVCTEGGAMLTGPLTLTVNGPVTLSVADAVVEEAEGATLDFVVSMSRARESATTVSYATSDDTATAGSDYTAASGTLTFAAGDTSKTDSITVHDDAHDEGDETLTLTLSNQEPNAVKLADASATGTITNDDPMPKAWMLRFGRTVGNQVVDTLTDRLAGGQGAHVTVAGITLTGEAAPLPEAEPDDPFGLPEWAKTSRLEEESQEITADDLLLRSSFHLSSGGEDGGAAFTAWGRVATGGFGAEVDHVAFDGDVTSTLVGFDAEWSEALAGVMLTRSRGDGAYRLDPAMGEDGGTVEAELTGVYPYARLDLNARVSAWALAGAGRGSITLDQDAHAPMKTALSMRMGALGVKGRVLEPGSDGGLGVNVKTDAMWVGTKSERSRDMVGAEGDVTRLRLIVEGERVFASGSGATFTPSAEVGLRHDAGDAETGAGVEVGGGVRYTKGPLSMEAHGRMLVAHEDAGYEEWGLSGAIRVSPDEGGRGLTLSIAPEWGQTGSATERLWGARDARELEGVEFEPTSRLSAEAGYGLGLARNRGVLTPYAGATFGEGDARTLRLGARWLVGDDVAFTVETTRAETANDGAHALTAQLSARF